MSTYRELVYMCLDQVKAISDDSTFTEDHAMFLLSKYRTNILKQAYQNGQTAIPESNYQTLCVDVEPYSSTDADICGKGVYLRSTEKIPFTLPFGGVTVYTNDFFGRRISYVSRERMKYVGNNKWTKNAIFATIGPDSYLYLKSANDKFLRIRKVTLTGIFEDADKANELACEKAGEVCDPLDRQYPLEEGLINNAIQATVRDLLGAMYRPKDNLNNANDDMATLEYFLSRNTKKGVRDLIEDNVGQQ